MAVVVEEVCPSVEELTSVVTGIPCHVQGCSKILFNTAALRMHVVKTHNVISAVEENVFTRNPSAAAIRKRKTKKIYYCPVTDCSRGKISNKPFPRLGQVKQHYMTVHAEKRYTCPKCSRGFGIEAACKRHESKCGQMFYCTCGCPFTTREALLMHARRKQHELPSSDLPIEKRSENKSRKSSCTNSGQTNTTIIVLTSNENFNQPLNKAPVTAQKYCTILPKPEAVKKVDSTNNTHNSSYCTTKKDAETQTICTMPLANIQAQSTQTLFGLQPSYIGSGILSAINQSSVGTQMNSPSVSSMMDLGSQVMLSGICPEVIHSSSVGTQHDGHIYVETLDSSTCYNSQSLLSLPTSPYLNSSETQTQDFEHVTLEDNAAQTLISILDMDPSCSADCGTQTQKMFEEIFGQTDVELTESQTQTWLSSVMPQDPILIDNDFNNRTTLEELVNMQTQTVMNDISFDVGLINTETQTIPESFGDNCWGYEANNRQTQMTQTGGLLYPFYSSNTSLMDTYTQTLLGDIVDTSLSNVQTQT